MSIHPLETHLQQRLDNHRWLQPCLKGKISRFPYRVKEGGTPKHLATKYLSGLDRMPNATDSRLPRYVVNVPMAHRPGTSSHQNVVNLFEKFKEEGFGIKPSTSRSIIQRRFAIVVGINQISSLDLSVNRRFAKDIRTMPDVEGIACRVFGFMWYPEWVNEDCEGSIYPPKKAFLLLKALNSNRAREARYAFEGSQTSLHTNVISQIPFQWIREKIKLQRETRDFVRHFIRSSPNAPVYYGVMDSDFKALRKDRGIFSRFDSLIAEKPVSVLSLGYSVSDDERPLIRLGVRIDMEVRQAMTSVIPFSAYLPEPCTIFLIRKPNEKDILHRLSFISRPSSVLENRRLVQCGRKKKIFDDVVFHADGGVVTGTPERMKTKKNGKVEQLTPKKIKQRSSLQALRAISQTHATPKQWADNLYVGLEFSCSRLTDATGPMMAIFGVFDPISRMFSSVDRFSVKVFDSIMKNYSGKLSEGQKNTLRTACTKLLNLGMTKEMVVSIGKAAKASGKAIHGELNRFAYLPPPAA